MTRPIIVIAAMLAAFASMPAYADIGHIGGTGKVDVINSQREPQYQPPAEARGPLLTIRFNRNFVYFQQALKEGVTSTQKVKPGATYRVVTSIPPGDTPSQTQRNAQQADANLQSVLQQLHQNGVSDAQVHVETSTGKPDEPQEIKIFVK